MIMSRLVTVRLSEFVCSVVAGEGADNREQLAEKVVDAIRCYLGDKGTYGPGWAYPRFLREEEYPEEVALQLEIDGELWDLLEEEAERQGVSPQKMVTHASLYVAGEVDAGRATRRILDGLEESAEKKAGISRRAAPPREQRRAR
jgi:hypothetical protein